MKKELLGKMAIMYDKFGIDIHNMPNYLQPQINNLVKEIIKLHQKSSNNTIYKQEVF